MSTYRALRRLLFWLFSLPVLLALTLLMAGGVAISTETGLRGLLALAERAAPGHLRYGHVSGRLLGPLRIDDLRYELDGFQLALTRGDFDWEPLDLLDLVLNVTQLHLDGLTLQLPPGQNSDSAPTTEAFTLPDIQLPLAINLADLQGHAIRIQPDGAPAIQIDAIVFKARTEADALTIETLEAWAPQGEIRLNGRLNPTGAYPLQARLAWQVLTPDYGTFNGQGEIGGELQSHLRLNQHISGALALDLEGEVSQPFDPQPGWSARTQIQIADLGAFVPDLTGRPLQARIAAKGVLTRFDAQGDIDATLPQLGSTKLRLTASGDEKAVTLHQLQLTTADRPMTLNASGALQFAELRFDATGQWQSLAWPLTGSPQLESPKGEFGLQGTPDDYQFRLAAELRGAEIPSGRWSLEGRGSDQALRELKLTGQTLEGSLQGNGELAWTPMVRWQAALSGQGLNPGAQWPDVPGKLNLRLKSDGALENGQLRAKLLLEELSGTLSGQPVRGNADLAIQDRNLTVKTLRLNAGDARLEADGSLAQRWDLRWKLDAPQLKSLIPGLSGSVTSNGKLTGAPEQPQVAATFAVDNLNYGDTRIRQAHGEIAADLGGTSRSQLKIAADTLVLGGQHWKTISLEGAGTPASHDFKAELVGDPGHFTLAVAGSLQLPTLIWQGRIAQLNLKDTVVGNWSLDKSVDLRASTKDARLDPLCLSSAPTRLCLQGQWEQTRGFSGKTQLANLTLERFKAFIPSGYALTTHVNGEASVSGRSVTDLQGKLNLTVAPGSLQVNANNQPLRITLNGGSVQLDSNGKTVNGQLRLDLARTGQLQANLQLHDPFGGARLNGALHASFTDLSVVSLFAPQVQKVNGQLQADITAAGALPKVALRGQIRLENTSATLPEFGLKLQNLQFTATSDGQGPLQLSASVRSGAGQLQLSGDADPLKLQANLSLKGQTFQAMDTTNLQIQISPDLKVAIAQHQVRIDGEVTVPRAFIQPGGMRPGAVAPSQDVVIVNGPSGEGPPSQPKGTAIYANVRVILGDDVQVETPAFKGKLKGRLLVEETPELAPRGSGTIEVAAGNYRIYGEEIEIQRGQLLFSSSPLDNPGLDLRVVRQSSESAFTGTPVTAGAQIGGTLKDPKLTLFSTPKLPNSSILSYLLFGRAPQGNGTGGESALLYKAANALGFGGGTLTKNLSETFGLDSLQLESGEGSKATSLMLGKYLSPDLYVGYGIGLFDTVNTFNVKYRLSKRLVFESNSSTSGMGADLIYTLEH